MAYSGSSKVEFCNRLGDDWKALADFLEMRPADQARFERGDEARGIWEWLENRKRLQELPAALQHIHRADLVRVLGDDHRFGHSNRQISDRGMRNQLRLNKEIDDLQRQWELLNAKLSGLNEQRIRETRFEEQFRLEQLIDATKTQRDQVEEQLKDRESQLAKVDSGAKEVTGRNGDQGQKKSKDLQDQPPKEVAGRNDDQDRVFPANRPTRKTKGRLIAAVIVLIATASIVALVALIGPASPRIQVSYYYRPAGQDELRTLPPGSELRSGDHYKIWFTAEQDSYVYLFYIDSNQDIYRLFPRENLQGIALNQTNPVKAGRQYQLPADDKAFVLPDDRLGQEKIYVLAFQEPNPALEQLYDALEQARQQQNTTRIADMQNLLLAKLQKEAPVVPAFTFVHLERK